jgi:hypothetical protein
MGAGRTFDSGESSIIDHWYRPGDETAQVSMGEIDRGARLLGAAEDSYGDGRALDARPRDRGAARCRFLHLATEPSAPAPPARPRVVLPPSSAPGLTRRFQGTGELVMKKPSRRAVVRTGVWAVPVVATAAPASAGTTTPQVEIESMGSGCQLPGRSMHDGETFFDYRMVVTFDNLTASPQVIALIDLTINGKPVTGFPTGSQVSLQPGPNPQLFVVNSAARSQRAATITYQYNGTILTQMVTFPDVTRGRARRRTSSRLTRSRTAPDARRYCSVP